MAAESSGMSSIHDDSDDNDDLFLSKPNGKTRGLVHLQSSRMNHVSSDNYYDDDRDYLKSGYRGSVDSGSVDSPISRQESLSPPDTPDIPLTGRLRQGSIVDGLLHEIYDRWHFGRHDSFDSDTLTECSSTSDYLWSSRHDFGGTSEAGYHSSVRRQTGALSRSYLHSQSRSQLERILADVQRSVAVMSARLVRQLKRRDRRVAKLGRNCDVVTAILQAASLKRQIDTRMRFSLQPPPGQSAFDQWKDAMKAVARLPMGIPPEFRKKVWLSLADHYLLQLRINWDNTLRFVFNERSNPDDDKLGVQIVKDLHRTGCSNFSGDDNEEDRAVLKRVLLAYARWNKRVGYCQGFNVIAALLLNVMDRKEDDALKVMIFLIDSVLPESYFANNLRALSVDMAVFRDLLGMTYPRLSKHLDRLQLAAQDVRTGACYEPPLTNVFTMQWFLTLFATCLPVSMVLRVWDSVLLEGSEILLRTALTIWGRLSKRIMGASSADEFYCLMGELSSSIMQGAILDGDALVKSIYSLAEFPLPHITELREKYTYNIRPFTPAGTGSKKGGGGSGSSRSTIKSMLGSDDDELDDDDITAMACMPGDMNRSSSDISVLGPGVYGSGSDPTVVKGTMQMERMSTDISNLKLQYQRLKQRQQQAHIIIAAASAKKSQSAASSSSSGRNGGKNNTGGRQRQRISPMSSTALLPNIESPTAMNHLFVGKSGKKMPASGKNRLVTDGPRISSELPTARKSSLLAKQLQAVANAQAVSKSQRMRSGSQRTTAVSAATEAATTCKNAQQGHAAPATSPDSTAPSDPDTDQSKSTSTNRSTPDTTQSNLTSVVDRRPFSITCTVPSTADTDQSKSTPVTDKSTSTRSSSSPLPAFEQHGKTSEADSLADNTSMHGEEQSSNQISEDCAVNTNFSHLKLETCSLGDDSCSQNLQICSVNDNSSDQNSKASFGNSDLNCETYRPEESDKVCEESIGTDHRHLSQSNLLIACLADKNNEAELSKQYESCSSGSHNVPSNFDTNTDNLSELASTSGKEENAGEKLCHVSSVPEVCVHSSGGVTSSEAVSTDLYDPYLTELMSDTLQEDSGIESSSTTSPSITPGKRLCQQAPFTPHGPIDDNDDQELILSVETSVTPDEDLEKTISVSQIESKSCGSLHEIETEEKHQVNEETCQEEVDGTPPVAHSQSRPPFVAHDNDSKKGSEVFSTQFSSPKKIPPQKLYLTGNGISQGHENATITSPDTAPDVHALLGIVATTSPQHKFIRSMSVMEDSYMPSPSLIETVSVPENLEVGEEANKSIVTNNGTAFDLPLDQDDRSHKKVASDSHRGQRKSRSASVQEKHHDLKRVNFEGVDVRQDVLNHGKHRLSSPSFSFPLNTSSGGNDFMAMPKVTSPTKPFNPFPIKLFNANRAKTGLKLGLYSASTLQQLKGVKGRTSSS